jgi:hypothetical protein
MPRTIISLNETEKDWLTRQAEAEQVPMTEIVRRALALYRRQARGGPEPDFEDLLERTRDLWQDGDGLAYQDRLRAEWERE